MTTSFPGVVPGSPRSFVSFVATFGRTLAFVLLAGGVGPAFLVLYVVLEPPRQQWMLLTGLGVTALDVVIAVAATVVIRRLSLVGSAALASVPDTVWPLAGQPAAPPVARPLGRADVLSLARTGDTAGGHPVLEVLVRLHHPDGTTTDETTRLAPSEAELALLDRKVLGLRTASGARGWEVDWSATAVLAGAVPLLVHDEERGVVHDLTGRVEPALQVLGALERHGIALSPGLDLRQHPAARLELLTIARAAQAPATPFGADVP